MLLVRLPASNLGNTGDAALVKTLKSELEKRDILATYMTPKEIHLTNTVAAYSGLIYMANDCLGYYGIDKSLINEFLTSNKRVTFINTSYGQDALSQNTEYIKSIINNKNVFFWARDEYSLEILRELGEFANQIGLCADLAHLAPNYVPVKRIDLRNKDLLNWVKSQTLPIIAVNIHEDFGDMNLLVRDQLYFLLNELKSSFSYLFIPHDARKKTEIEANSSLFKIFNENSFLSTCLDPLFEISILEHLHSTVTCRMHLGILSLRALIPPIIIGYNGVKAKGLLRHWQIEEISYHCPLDGEKRLVNRFRLLNDNHPAITDKLRSNCLNVRKLASKQLDDLASIYAN